MLNDMLSLFYNIIQYTYLYASIIHDDRSLWHFFTFIIMFCHRYCVLVGHFLFYYNYFRYCITLNEKALFLE